MTIRLPPLVSKTVTLVRKPLEHCSDVITLNDRAGEHTRLTSSQHATMMVYHATVLAPAFQLLLA